MDLVLDNLQLVKFIANKYYNDERIPFDDLYQEGCVGLVKAAKEYDNSKLKFSAYASLRIQWAIINLMKRRNVMYTPPDTVDLANKIAKQELDELEPSEISKILKAKEHLVKDALAHLKLGTLSLEFEYENKDGSHVEMHDFVGYEQRMEDGLIVEELMTHLKESEREIVKLSMKGYPAHEICGIVGRSYDSTRVILYQARKKLKKVRDLHI